ncbi:vigilin [Nephila pilipes]|uniref:Vigilin n=1 Tax=Nephila pilipes TaxID=299642 RepID=A0A8X6NHR6_NEPPI|nr:vigilin [Nephila pilipes]
MLLEDVSSDEETFEEETGDSDNEIASDHLSESEEYDSSEGNACVQTDFFVGKEKVNKNYLEIQTCPNTSKLSNKHPYQITEGVTVSFPKIGCNSSKGVFKEAKKILESAKQRLHEIVENLETIVTVECVNPQAHHRTFLGTRGSKVQNIQRQFNITIS